jgi:hypothetical protein
MPSADPRAPGWALAARALALLAALAALGVLGAVRADEASAQAPAATPATIPAPAAGSAEIALARRFAPVVRLRQQPDACVDDVPYVPIDVDLLMGDDEVALRGPWNGTDLVAVAPTAARLGQGLWGYHLDFPGETLDPGCTYEDWAARLQPRAPSTTYARVVTEPGHPGRLALQYWFFYVFNDWKNKHEGDWEMIQLNFDAATPEEAVAEEPTEVGYSQHSSAERAGWDDEKLEKVDGTHPVVHPAEGSQANFYESRLYLMRSSAEGVGCDNALGPSRDLSPVVDTVPTARADYLRTHPWLGFDGRWGERQQSVFNGPTGPADKTQWTHPFTWAEESWRDTSFVVPAGGSFGTQATDFFCGAVAAGSEVLRQAKLHPGRSAAIAGGLAVLLLWGLSRTRWTPGSPLRVPRRRAWGQLVWAAARMMLQRPGLFVGIGLVFVPLGLLITFVQWLLFQVAVLAPLVDEAGQRNAFVDALAFGVGLAFTLLAYVVVQGAVARALADIDAGRPVTVRSAYRPVLRRLGLLAQALVVILVVLALLNLTVLLIPVAVYVLVRWSLVGVVASLEGGSPLGLLGRSRELTRGRWWRTAGITLGVAGAALLLGPAVGTLVLLFTGAAFNLVNFIAALVYVTALPFAALATAYLYFDLRVRRELAPVHEHGPGDLPAEITTPI